MTDPLYTPRRGEPPAWLRERTPAAIADEVRHLRLEDELREAEAERERLTQQEHAK